MFRGCRQESSRSPSSAPPPCLCSQRDRSVKVECAAPSPHARLCSVGHPVFQTGAKVSGAQDEKGALREQGPDWVGPGAGEGGTQGSCSSELAPGLGIYHDPCLLPPGDLSARV